MPATPLLTDAYYHIQFFIPTDLPNSKKLATNARKIILNSATILDKQRDGASLHIQFQLLDPASFPISHCGAGTLQICKNQVSYKLTLADLPSPSSSSDEASSAGNFALSSSCSTPDPMTELCTEILQKKTRKDSQQPELSDQTHALNNDKQQSPMEPKNQDGEQLHENIKGNSKNDNGRTTPCLGTRADDGAGSPLLSPAVSMATHYVTQPGSSTPPLQASPHQPPPSGVAMETTHPPDDSQARLGTSPSTPRGARTETDDPGLLNSPTSPLRVDVGVSPFSQHSSAPKTGLLMAQDKTNSPGSSTEKTLSVTTGLNNQNTNSDNTDLLNNPQEQCNITPTLDAQTTGDMSSFSYSNEYIKKLRSVHLQAFRHLSRESQKTPPLGP